MFFFITIISTLVTGLFWFIDKFFPFKKRIDQYRIIIPNFAKSTINKKTILDLKFLRNTSSFFPMLIVILIMRSFFYEPFRIPSGSMMPTLLIGDFILVKKFSYNIKDPIFHKSLIEISSPKRGDVVVFQYPKDPRLNYIKRVIGLPGDKITYDSVTKKIILQPNYGLSKNYSNVAFITYSSIELSNFVQTLTKSKKNKISNNFFNLPKGKIKENSIRLLESTEKLGDIIHHILIVPFIRDRIDMYYHQKNQNLSTWIVPVDHYFVMGDNRDNSFDSRYWGFVPKKNLVGKATIIWMSLEKQEGKWPTGIRWDRIGTIQ